MHPVCKDVTRLHNIHGFGTESGTESFCTKLEQSDNIKYNTAVRFHYLLDFVYSIVEHW